MKLKNPKLFVASILISQLAGVIGGAVTAPAIPTWYVSLNKPSFNPPSWLFGPVWITLYTLMGISLYLVWRKGLDDKKVKSAATIFLVHLVINSFWSIVFFGLKNLFFAFVVILVLWLMIVYIIKLFFKINKTSAYLLIPYILWVSFATLLNFFIWRLN